MTIEEKYNVDCPGCNEQFYIVPSNFMRLFEQKTGFCNCPLCDAHLYAELINNKVKVEIIEGE